MGKWCAVPGCRTGSRTAEKRSVFRVPKDITTWKKWEQAIPGIVKLRQSDIVCEKHFNEEDIAREWVKFDANGRVISRVSYKYPQLKKLAVPTRFHDGKENCEPSQLHSSSVVDQNNGSLGAMFSFPMKSPLSSCDHLGDNPLHSQRASNGYSSFENREQAFNLDRDERLVADSLGRFEYSDHAYAKQMSHAQRNVIPETSTSADLARVPSPVNRIEIGLSLSLMDVSTCETSVVDSLTPETPDKLAISLEINKQMPEENAITDEDFSAYVPEEWGWAKTSTEIVQRTIFTHTILKMKNGKHCPVAQKSVTLDVNKNLQYFVYGRHIDPENTNLQQILNGKEKLKDVLERFKGMNICSGLGDMSTQFVQAGEAYEDYVDKWRCNGCSLLCKKNRCDSCINVRKCILQRTARLKNRPTLSRIGGVSNPVDRRKFQAMRMKIRRETRRRFRAQDRLKHVMSSLKAQEAELASLKDPSVDAKLAALDISTSQKLVVKEIVAAARRKDPRYRRYTDEWLMLCMLMSIRSPKDFEFLRKNNILPLPCTRTIRNYFSLINAKCGFDEGFAKLLEKHFASKSPLQRHGVLLLDEINLRRSVAVCSRDLTYRGLTDFGDVGQQSTDINEQATHGLVLMFQPLADTYTQPIAVFASKNSVKGEELAKIVLRAILYVEQCGAMIHGVISDGAATNTKMWSHLGIRGTMDNIKTWFTHPLDDKRKIFVFSDICHVIKNIRNRLYNNKKLRLKSTEDYVCWKYFETLYNLDKNHPGNARACPKITNRHVVLDNTAKMRVRLATQIFSNSVAHGLAFYQSHGCKGLSGCEATIAFCKRMNDMFDALNRKSPNQGLIPQCDDFKLLEDTLRWLDEWESAVEKKDISVNEFLTAETSRGLRLSLRSTIDLCVYLIDKFEFQYLLTGKLNQDNLEKFFGTIRQCAGCNDHPNCPTFLQLYKLLSVYSVIKPPKYGNCTVSSDFQPATLITISDIKAIYGTKREGKSAEYLRKIKEKLDLVLNFDDWEADDIIDLRSEHDYSLSPILDCIIYYVTGYLCKQILKKYKSCAACEEAVRLKSSCGSSESQLVALKSRGGLIHANHHFFHLIRHVEASFAKYSSRVDVFDVTLDEVLNTYSFTFPCKEHASEILSYAIVYYIRLRMRQNAHQENLKQTKKFVVKKKLAKFTNE